MHRYKLDWGGGFSVSRRHKAIARRAKKMMRFRVQILRKNDSWLWSRWMARGRRGGGASHQFGMLLGLGWEEEDAAAAEESRIRRRKERERLEGRVKSGSLISPIISMAENGNIYYCYLSKYVKN